MDGELQEKSLQELKRLATALNSAVRKGEDTVWLGGVSVSATALLKRETDLQPLALSMPTTSKGRKRYRLTVQTKPVQWSVDWSILEDSQLLVGVYEHGFGNWENIKENNKNLSKKVIPISI